MKYFLLALIFLSCSQDTRHAGVTDMPNEDDAIVVGRFVHPSGSVVVNALVKLYPDNLDTLAYSKLDHSALASTKTNSQGSFEFKGLKPGNYWVEASISSLDSASIGKFTAKKEELSQSKSLTISPTRSFRGIFSPTTQFYPLSVENWTVHAVNTPYRGTISPTGSFILTRLPQDTRQFAVVKYFSEQNEWVSLASGWADSTSQSETTSVDMVTPQLGELGKTMNFSPTGFLGHDPYNERHWWSYADKSTGGNTQVKTAYEQTSTFEDSAAVFEYRFEKQSAWPLAGVGFSFRTLVPGITQSVNASGLKSVRFRIQSHGQPFSLIIRSVGVGQPFEIFQGKSDGKPFQVNLDTLIHRSKADSLRWFDISRFANTLQLHMERSIKNVADSARIEIKQVEFDF